MCLHLFIKINTMKHILTSIFLSVFGIVNAQKIPLVITYDSIQNGDKFYINRELPQEYYSPIIFDSAYTKDYQFKIKFDQQNFASPYRLNTEFKNNFSANSELFYLKNAPLNLKLKDFHSSIKNDIPERAAYEKHFKQNIKEWNAYNDYRGQLFLKYKFDTPKEKQDSLNTWYKRNWLEEMDLLKSYIKTNSKSEIALWKIIAKYESYKEYTYDELLNQFDPIIKQSYPYTVLTQNIHQNKVFAIEKIFPEMTTLKTFDGQPYLTDLSKNKYTLIDFWFGTCKPCLVTFPKLKELYSTYHSKGFEIQAIAAEHTKYVNQTKQVIEKYELPWLNALDENRTFTNANKITSFPTSYLVDQQGKIIQKDMSLEELEKFLANNLK